MSCSQVQGALSPYVDGELDPPGLLWVERHLAECERCAEWVKFTRAMKRANRTSVLSTGPSASLRNRIERSASLLADHQYPGTNTALDVAASKPLGWRRALPWMAAAAFALVMGGGFRAFDRDAIGAAQLQASAHAPIDDFVMRHTRELPPEEVDPVRIRNKFSPIVGVPVRPVRFVGMDRDGSPYTFVGARLMPLHNEHAAVLSYDLSGSRVSVYVFDPSRISIRSACCLVPHVVRIGKEVKTIFVGHSKGYSLVVSERDGVGYAVASDLEEKNVMQLAADL